MKNRFFIRCIGVTVLVVGTLAILIRLAQLTDIFWVYLNPICYIDWLFIGLAVTILGVLYLQEVYRREKLTN